MYRYLHLLNNGILLQFLKYVSSCLDSEGVSHHFHKPYFLLEGAFRHYMTYITKLVHHG